jgi:L-rhamnose mutarotase
MGGLLIGYLETDDYQAALDAMAKTEVNERWQAEMAPYFAELDGRPPDQGFTRIGEIFHLD